MKERIAAQLARDAAAEKGRWVWVYHAPPEGSRTSAEFGRSFGDGELTQWIETYRPDFVFCGHAHNAPFRAEGSWIDRVGTAWVFNAGHQPGPVPAHIALSIDDEAALWFSIAGPEMAPLDRAPHYPLRKLVDPPAWLPLLD